MSLGEFSDGYNKGYAAGYDDGCVYRTILEARVRRLEAEVLEARAEAAQWARELDGERAAVVAHLRAAAHGRHPIEADTPMLSPGGSGLLLLEAARIERGEHRAGGSDV